MVFIFWLGYDCPFCKSAAPQISSDIVNIYNSNPDFVAIGIDTWDGSATGVQNFKTQTGLEVEYLMNGSGVANTYNTTYDRLSVVDKNGILKYKGTQSSANSIDAAKTAVNSALQEIVTGVDDFENAGSALTISPNPLTNQATIRFVIEDRSRVEMNLFDLQGRLIKTFGNQIFSPGQHELTLSGTGLKSGIYLLKFRNDQLVTSQKLIIK